LPRQRLPWVASRAVAINPERVAHDTPSNAALFVQPFQGCDEDIARDPRVAASRQPWAVECNPFRVAGCPGSPARGLVLIVVLVVLALLALGATAFSEMMLAENQSAQYSGRRLQARAFAESGLEMSLWFLSQTADEQQRIGGHYDNASSFAARPVADEADGLDPGRFTISAPMFDEEGRRNGDRYGLQDESAKINLNAILAADELTPALPADASADGQTGSTAGTSSTGQASGTGQTSSARPTGGRQLLVQALGDLGMTDALADRILDFIDPDSEPREFGAEADYYASLGIKPKNGPLESLEELVLVHGVDWRLVFGRDLNRNGLIDDDEAGLEGEFYDNLGEQAQRGWSAFLTIYSAEKNLNPEGLPKIDLNNNDLETLYSELSDALGEQWATYIVAYRQNGAATNQPTGQKQQRSGGLDFEKTGRARLSTVLDLVGVEVVATTFKDTTNSIWLESPFPDPSKDPAGATSLGKLLDYAAVNTAPVIGGRISLNEAPEVILSALPGITDENRDKIVGGILTNRDPEMLNPSFRHETWLLERGIVTLAEMKQLLPLVCAHGDIYRADVLGYFDPDASGRVTGPAVRLDVVIDATRPKPRLLFWRDISHLGTKAALEAAVANQ
jgi:hypothetical protein